MKKGHIDKKAAALRKEYEEKVKSLADAKNADINLAIIAKNIAVHDARSKFESEVTKVRKQIYG